MSVVLAFVALAVAAPARASTLLTWPTSSRYVDPSGQTFNSAPSTVPYPPSDLPVNVLLPNGYNARHCYPVLYLLHGHGDGYWSWMDAAHGDLPDVAPGFPGIVVMPEAAQGWYTDWWNGGARGDPGWERYYLDELIPLVEHRLHICAGRRSHAIAGLSMGGEGAIYLASQRPDYFGAAASFSGSLSIQRSEWPTGFNTQGQNYTQVYGDVNGFYATGHNPVALVGNLRYTRLFVTVGDGVPDLPGPPDTFGSIAEADLHQHADDFVAAAQRAGDDVTYHPRHGIHDWPYWRRALADALASWGFFKPVAEHPKRWSYETVAQRSEAWGFRFAFTAPPNAVETFSRNGKRLRGEGSGTVRIVAPNHRRFTARLPFNRALPKAKHRRRRHDDRP